MKAIVIALFLVFVSGVTPFALPPLLIKRPQKKSAKGRLLSVGATATAATYLFAQSAGEPFSLQDTGREDQEEKNRRLLLGMPGAAAASDKTEKWKIRLQLMKPITWVPLCLGVMCGAAASGNYHWMWNPFVSTDRNALLGLEDAAKGFATMVLAGPLMEGYSQTINDWYDKDIDAINEPYRPIPSGAISAEEVQTQFASLAAGSLALACAIDAWCAHTVPVVLGCALCGTLMGYLYSAPPIRLKQNGWSGDITIGLCYLTLPWLCGHSAFGQLDRPESWLL
jgi:chlorophyll synthase